ncbi:MAG: HupE/UreJ family protein [Vicinamibacterales bacterium]
MSTVSATRRTRVPVGAVLLVAGVLAGWAPPLHAHPAPFSYLDLRLGPSGIEGALVVHDFDVAHELGLEDPAALLAPTRGPALRDQLVAVLARRLRLSADGATLPIHWGRLEVLAERQSVRLALAAGDRRPGRVDVDARLFPYDPVHQTFINVYEEDVLAHQAILDDTHTTFTYYAGTLQGTRAVVRTFVPSGIEHILIGPDHILFLIGLLLPGGSLRRLAAIVTAFTIGHSITLSLASLNIVSPPASIVEPTIALSIVFVGADNLLVSGSQGRDIRAGAAAVFGLVHGFGFASVLREVGLPQTALGWSLFSFNLGVEIGQLAVVLVVASLLAALRRRHPRLGQGITVGGSVVVILAGAYWFIQRITPLS